MDVTHVNRTEHGEKCIFMQEYKLKVYIYALKSAKSAANILIRLITPYSSTHYAMYKYTRVKNLPITEYNTTYIVSY